MIKQEKDKSCRTPKQGPAKWRRIYAEKCGCALKIDILGVSVLDKLAYIEKLVNARHSLPVS